MQHSNRSREQRIVQSLIASVQMPYFNGRKGLKPEGALTHIFGILSGAHTRGSTPVELCEAEITNILTREHNLLTENSRLHEYRNVIRVAPLRLVLACIEGTLLEVETKPHSRPASIEGQVSH